MTGDEKLLLEAWLVGDDETKRRHAAYRLDYESHPERHVATAATAPVIPAPLYPSFARQAWNASKAAGRVIAAAAQGQKILVDQKEKDRRLAICKACSFFDALRQRCTKCGCASRVKDWLATEVCPIGKW